MREWERGYAKQHDFHRWFHFQVACTTGSSWLYDSPRHTHTCRSRCNTTRHGQCWEQGDKGGRHGHGKAFHAVRVLDSAEQQRVRFHTLSSPLT